MFSPVLIYNLVPVSPFILTSSFFCLPGLLLIQQYADACYYFFLRFLSQMCFSTFEALTTSTVRSYKRCDSWKKFLAFSLIALREIQLLNCFYFAEYCCSKRISLVRKLSERATLWSETDFSPLLLEK